MYELLKPAIVRLYSESLTAQFSSWMNLLNFVLCIMSARMAGLGQKWARLAPNGINLGLFHIRFQYILIKTSPGFVSFGTNLTHFKAKSDIATSEIVGFDKVTMFNYIWGCIENIQDSWKVIRQERYFFSLLWS